MITLNETIIKRFQTKFVSDEADKCWNYQASKSKSGYGRFNPTRTEHIYAHRLSWMLFNEKIIPEEKFVLHRCDNPSCVNPHHLFLGTLKENCLDMLSKGRGHNQSKTTCKRGHPFTEDNTYFEKSDSNPEVRQCLKCRRDRKKINWHKTEKYKRKSHER